MSVEARSGRDASGQHGGQRWFVDLHDQALHAAQPAPCVGDMVPEAFGQCLGELPAGADVAQHLVAARLLDGRRQRPRTRDLHLERTVVPLGLLLQPVEVLGEQAARPALIDARRVGEPPARWLQVCAELADDGEGPADHGRGRAATGELGQVRKVRQLAEHGAYRFDVRRVVAAGHGPDAGRDGHRCSGTPTRRVALIVAEPTTRVPS